MQHSCAIPALVMPVRGWFDQPSDHAGRLGRPLTGDFMETQRDHVRGLPAFVAEPTRNDFPDPPNSQVSEGEQWT
jgi:hypothetical protein